jgi:hypothetical protein
MNSILVKYRLLLQASGVAGYFAVFILLINPYRVYRSTLSSQLALTALVTLSMLVLVYLLVYFESKLKRKYWLIIFIPIVYYVGLFVMFGKINQEDLILMSFSAAIVPIFISILSAPKKGKIKKSEVSSSHPLRTIVIIGSNKDDMIELAPLNFISFEANDNYVNILYLKEGVLNKKMIRSTLKKVSDQLEGHDFLKIHRSIIINKNHAAEVMGGAQNKKVKMKFGDVEFPISRDFNANEIISS